MEEAECLAMETFFSYVRTYIEDLTVEEELRMYVIFDIMRFSHSPPVQIVTAYTVMSLYSVTDHL